MPAMGQLCKEIPAPRGAGQSPKEDEDWDGLAAIHGISETIMEYSRGDSSNAGIELFTHIAISNLYFFPQLPTK